MHTAVAQIFCTYFPIGRKSYQLAFSGQNFVYQNQPAPADLGMCSFQICYDPGVSLDGEVRRNCLLKPTYFLFLFEGDVRMDEI